MPTPAPISGTPAAFRLLRVGQASTRERMLRDVAAGLGDPDAAPAQRLQRSIPPTYFYDAEGSRIYEDITALPEYYPTRTEAALLADLGPGLMARLAPRELVELGSGSSTKTRAFFDSCRRDPLRYVPIDVSCSMLDETGRALRRDYPFLRVLALCGPYEDALATLPPSPGRLLLFLGGTIGNFAPPQQEQFFSFLARRMAAGSHLLLGFDRRAHEGKPAQVIHDAYNDAQGVTARFNLNLLAHLNRELQADFDLSRWSHRAVYNPVEHQIEMYLVSGAAQQVRIAALGRSYRFAAGETILTELSRKFDPEELAGWFSRRGFRCIEHFTDRARYFGLLLLQRETQRKVAYM